MIDLDELERKALNAGGGIWEIRSTEWSFYAVDPNEEWGSKLSSAISGKNNVEHAVAANPSVVLDLIRRLRESERDAARYRWLRSKSIDSIEDGDLFVTKVDKDMYIIDSSEWDVAIDKEMEQSNG